MEQVYWLSPPTEPGTDTRLLLYRYGNFVYAGSVLTEPVRGLEYLPGVLTGIQAVQGQVPYLCEVRDLPTDGPYTASLLALQRAMDLVHSQLDVLTEKLGDLASQPGNEWVDSEGAALYFEIETVPGYTCNVSIFLCSAGSLLVKPGLFCASWERRVKEALTLFCPTFPSRTPLPLLCTHPNRAPR
jgi:hypothetical protein